MARDGEGGTLRRSFQDNPGGQGLLLVGLSLLAFGMVMVYSACMSVSEQREWYNRIEVRHILFALLAVLALGTLWRIDYHVLDRGRRLPVLAAVLLGTAIALCVAVLIPGIGAKINGARRWILIPLGPVPLSFQPSEIIKISMVLFLACWLGRRGEQIGSFRRTFLPAIGLIGICCGLVIIEDFGTACVIGVSGAVVLLLAGVPWHYLATLIPPAAGVFYLFVVREDYRWRRILAFVDPWDESTRWTYQVRQSLIAIGSGGLWGKGLGQGQLKLGFVPEDNSDFIFSVICEELGFIGAAIVLGLIAMLLYLVFRAVTRAGDRTGRLIAGGLGFVICFQALMHVAVNIGTAPPTGINLPLVSAGGTGLVLVAAALAAVISVTAHGHPDLCPLEPGGASEVVLPPPKRRRRRRAAGTDEELSPDDAADEARGASQDGLESADRPADEAAAPDEPQIGGEPADEDAAVELSAAVETLFRASAHELPDIPEPLADTAASDSASTAPADTQVGLMLFHPMAGSAAAEAGESARPCEPVGDPDATPDEDESEAAADEPSRDELHDEPVGVADPDEVSDDAGDAAGEPEDDTIDVTRL